MAGRGVRLLLDILGDMEDIAENGGDQEADHANADALLLEAIQVLADGTADRGTAVRLMVAYDQIGKWYA